VTLKQGSYLSVTVSPSGASGDAYDTAGTLFDHFDFGVSGCDLPDGGTPMQPDASMPIAFDGSVVVTSDAAVVVVSFDGGPLWADASAMAGADATTVGPGRDAQTGAGVDAGLHGAPTSGCGCAMGGSAIGSVFALAALLALKRRRSGG